LIYCIEGGFIATILITGANGFVGRQILSTLRQLEHNDLNIIAACRNPKKLPAEFSGEVRVGDLRDEDYLDRVLVGVDVICHAASWSSYLPRDKHSTKLYLEPTLALIQRAIEWRVKRFVNLSSISVAHIANRDNALTMGCPKRGWPMLNCMLAIEDYMNVHSDSHCNMVNLRAGILAGESLNTGLLPSLLLSLKNKKIPRVLGNYRFLPIVDVKDLAQAFARAALAPGLNSFESFNICGAQTPNQQQVFDFINTGSGIGLPLKLAQLYSRFMALSQPKTQWNDNLLYQMTNPLISIDAARQSLGYDPEISWQASLQIMLQQKNSQHPPQLQQRIKS